jgi:hypothetical protein
LRAGHTTSCGYVKSVGEMRINTLLSQANINYTTQYAVFIDKAYYRFDCAILDNDNNLIRLIEFDGEQHYKESNYYDYQTIHRNDLRKNQYCKDNNIPLVRIPHWERDNISLDLIFGDKYLI